MQMEVRDTESEYVIGRLDSVKKQLDEHDYLEVKGMFQEAADWNDAGLFSKRCRYINQQYRLSKYRMYMLFFFLFCSFIYVICYFLFL